MNNADKPAFPVSLGEKSDGSMVPLEGMVDGGLTKRERFAMAAMQGILANPNIRVGDSRWPIWLEYTSRRIAESQLKELEE